MPFGQATNTTQLNLHNVYSQLLAETGAIGLLLLGVGFIGAVRPALHRIRKSELACTGTLLVFVVLGAFTRNQLYGGLPETTVLMIGLAFAIAGPLLADSGA